MCQVYIFVIYITNITEEGFLISSCYSLELCIQMGISFLFSFAFSFSFFLGYLYPKKIFMTQINIMV